jgi:hypothetical protein
MRLPAGTSENLPPIGQHVPMRELDALGSAGGSRGVEQQCWPFQIN